MPALPELPHGQGTIGGVEVHRQPQPQEPGGTGGNVAVAGEIEIQLQRVAQDHQPGRRRTEISQAAPAVVHHRAEAVRQQHLFDGAAADGVDPGGGIGPVGPQKALPLQLGKEVPGPQDGAGGDGGEKESEQGQGRVGFQHRLPGVQFLQQPQLLEGEKAQTQRRPPYVQNAAGEKAGVFEHQQHTHVPHAGKGQCPAAVGGIRSQPQGRGPGHHHAHGQHRKTLPAAAQHVEYQAAQLQGHQGGGTALFPQNQAHAQGYRQKGEKGQRLKAHDSFSVRPPRRASVVLRTWVRLWHRPG